ncbi:ribonuclease HI family protein [Sphingomonas sp. BIUV-7]|uniref:Ribonuclease HI family protein n=1 Tax=Sphingomonas natans TaxID=3063330 RepID=A0ABT8YDZ7_9SPHN|nr:ribonuclease HI family protein [Sphingomonas sp. BIUV-7]MDO6415800.1 ribonuclease HI family protein [Sphingomonas sp. BIUV-7]
MTVFFDGGCRPNPGAMSSAVVCRGKAAFRDDLGAGDNNEAEWLALLHAAEFAADTGASDVTFVGDSMLVVKQASGQWRCRSPHLQPYLDAFRIAVAGFARVHLRHVARSKNLAGIALDRRGLP